MRVFKDEVIWRDSSMYIHLYSSWLIFAGEKKRIIRLFFEMNFDLKNPGSSILRIHSFLCDWFWHELILNGFQTSVFWTRNPLLTPGVPFSVYEFLNLIFIFASSKSNIEIFWIKYFCSCVVTATIKPNQLQRIYEEQQIKQRDLYSS